MPGRGPVLRHGRTRVHAQVVGRVDREGVPQRDEEDERDGGGEHDAAARLHGEREAASALEDAHGRVTFLGAWRAG